MELHRIEIDGRYRLTGLLGRGGMASVVEAFDRRERRAVALKLPHRGIDRGEVHPLIHEFVAGTRVDHPCISSLLGIGFARAGPLPPGTPYLVGEVVRGRPCRPPLPEPVVVRIFEQLIDALAHVHEAGIVHRDLKPGNVLVEAGDRIKLIDFGLSVAAGRSGRLGRVSGSFPFLAPECVLGAPVDGRTDLYSLGILLYFLIAGRLPMETKDPEAMLRWHLAGPPVELQTAHPVLGPLVGALTRRRVDDRPAGAREVQRSWRASATIPLAEEDR